MKKIITSLGMVVFAAAIVVGGTGAFFSDTETSTANVFTAGAIDLLVDNSSYGFDWNRPLEEGDPTPTGVWGPNENNSWGLRDLDTCGIEGNENCLFFDFIDLKPGDYGEDTISLHVQNDAWACMAFNLTATPDNGQNDPEVEAGDDAVDTDGELQDYLEFVFWHDDGDNVLEVGEQVIQGLSGLAKDIFTGTKLAIADSSTGEPLPANAEGEASYIGKGWCFGDLVVDPEVPAVNAGGPTPGNTGFTCDPTGNHNIAQTDGIEVDVMFEAIQARHNDTFRCVPPTTEPETATVTVDKQVAFTDLEIEGVDVSDFTLTIDGPGDPMVVVDNIPTAGLPVGTYSISEVYSGDPANVTFNASFSGGCTEVGDTGVGTMEVVAGVNPTCVITNSVALATT